VGSLDESGRVVLNFGNFYNRTMVKEFLTQIHILFKVCAKRDGVFLGY
jgi:hypothetical protein